MCRCWSFPGKSGSIDAKGGEKERKGRGKGEKGRKESKISIAPFASRAQHCASSTRHSASAGHEVTHGKEMGWLATSQHGAVQLASFYQCAIDVAEHCSCQQRKQSNNVQVQLFRIPFA